MSDETASSLAGIPKYPDKVANFIDKETREKVMMQVPDGSIGRGYTDENKKYQELKYQVKFGESFTNTLVEVCRTTFSDVRLLDEPSRPDGYNLVRIGAENIDIGFEFSASESRKPALDKARISLILRTIIVDKDGKEIANYKHPFKEDQIEKLGITNQMAAYENCINKVVVKYVDRISNILARQPSTVSQADAPEYTLTINQTGNWKWSCLQQPHGNEVCSGGRGDPYSHARF